MADAWPPTVEGLCEQWLPLANRYAIEWCEKYPHLASEFKSRAALDLFTSARSYVAKGPEFWGRMRFVLWLRICIVRGAKGVIAKEMTRHPIGFLPQSDQVADRIDHRHGSPDEVAEEAERRERVLTDLDFVIGLFPVLGDDALDLLLRHYIDGEPIFQIAREEGCPHSTIGARITRAVKLLREAARLAKEHP